VIGLVVGLMATAAVAVEPQVKTDHPWFPGELSCSTFERLFATQAALYERVTGRKTDNDEDKALASWYWRNLNYYHLLDPKEPTFAGAERPGMCPRGEAVRDYWTGLFGYGFGLCGMNHSQWTAEMEYLLGHCRGRTVGVAHHNAFEAFLKDPQYGPQGDWASLDSDLSSVVFDDPVNPRRLRSLWDMAFKDPPPGRTPRTSAEQEAMFDNEGAPAANRGWMISGLHYPSGKPADATDSDLMHVYKDVRVVEVLSGYAGVPPLVALKRNETFRRYLRPGLGGTDYAFWGSNTMAEGIPGPARDATWSQRPEAMFRAIRHGKYGWARHGNAVFTYEPNFADGSYREGVIAEDAESVTFFFQSPYAVAAMPAAAHRAKRDAVEHDGATGGLVITARAADCPVQISTDAGRTWSPPVALKDRVDLTDLVKGRHGYRLRFNAAPVALAGKGIAIRTVCMANDRTMPHLKDGGTTVEFAGTGKGVFSTGGDVREGEAFITAGGFGQKSVEFTVPVPGGRPILEIHAVGWVASGVPPDPTVAYAIDYSTDDGRTWKPIVKDWRVELLGYQAADWWSQSFCFGSRDVVAEKATSVKVRFSNPKNAYRRAQVDLVYDTGDRRPVEVAFDWSEAGRPRSAMHVFDPARPAAWTIPTGKDVVTNWVEMRPVAP
jgi:hypothetical protein